MLVSEWATTRTPRLRWELRLDNAVEGHNSRQDALDAVEELVEMLADGEDGEIEDLR